MPRLIITPGAARGLARCRSFLIDKSPRAAARAGEAIGEHLSRLETFPEIGRPREGLPGARELIIGFGDSDYVALYRFIPEDDAVYILAVRHQREAGY